MTWKYGLYEYNYLQTKIHMYSVYKSAHVLLQFKKLGLDPQVFKNYRPVSNLYFCPNLLKGLFLPASSNTLLITILLIHFSLHIGVVTVTCL